MIGFIYAIVIFIATFLGASAGLGGAVIGGNIGSSMFSSLLKLYDANMIKMIQASSLVVLLVGVLINTNMNFKTFHIKNPF